VYPARLETTLITEFHAKDYGPLKDVKCALTPLHAFIGPNDGGKSTLLRGIVSILNQAAHAEPIYFIGGRPMNLGMSLDGGSRFQMSANLAPQFEVNPSDELVKWIRGGAWLCRFEADTLRRPSSLATPAERMNWIEQRGLGLAGALDILLRRNDNSFQEISRDFVSLFPTVARVQLPNISATETQISIVLLDGTEVDARFMSEGMLYFLAYATLQRLNGGALIAVEEPETGLHPSRISEIVRILRKVSESGTQVIIATHSPLVVNELQPSEVSVVTRAAEAGTKVTPMLETADFKSRSKVYALGELWLSYANGEDEAPLLEGGPREILRDKEAAEETPKT
jgi:predicted ATPase